MIVDAFTRSLWSRAAGIISPKTAGDYVYATRIGMGDYSPSDNSIITGSEIFTNQTSSRYGYLINVYHEPAGVLGGTTANYGGISQVQWRTDVDGSALGYGYGHQSNANTLYIVGGGSGDLNTAIGEHGRARHRSDGVLTNAIGVRGDVYNDNASTNDGNITTASSFQAVCDSKKTTGVIGTRYGLEIQDITTAAHTTNQYGIYCPALVGATGDNYFINNVSAPSYFGTGLINTSGNISGGTADFGDGGTTNYSQFEADGTLEFNGTATVWNDENMGAITLNPIPARVPDVVQMVDNVGANMGIYTYGFNVDEGVSGFIEIPHTYKEGSDFTFHVHWYGIAAPTGTDKVKWELTYSIVNYDDTMPAPTIITIEADYDTQYEEIITSFAAIDGTGIGIGEQFCFSLERIDASADEYGGDSLVQTVGIHFEEDTVGSRQILTK